MNGATRAILIGLLVGGIVSGYMGYRFTVGAVADQKIDLGNRQATMQVMALAELTGAVLESESGVLQDLVVEWDRRHDDVSNIRVLRIGGARLLASTIPADIERGLNKRVPREDKPFFDTAKALQSGHTTNVREGGFRKDEVVYEVQENGHVRVTAPYVIEDKIKGAVRMDVEPRLDTQSVSPVNALILVVLPLFAFGFVSLILRREDRWIPLSMALAVMIGALYMFNKNSMFSYQGARAGYEGQLAVYYGKVRTDASALAQVHTPAYTLAETNAWDTDEFRRPLNLFAVDGIVDQTAVTKALEISSVLLQNGLWFASGLGIALLGFIGSGWAGRGWRTLVVYREAYSYITPAFIGMLVLVFFPFGYGIILSFTGQTLYNTDKALWDIWVGLENYARILGDVGIMQTTETGTQVNFANFYWTAFITVMWTVCNVTIGVTVGLILALALNVKGFQLKGIYRAILILPWALPTYVTALIWKGLFHKQYGTINYMITLFGGEPIAWFDGVFTAFITGIAVNGWLSFPFMMVICLGGLQSISADMYEAAKLDGASRFQQFRYITLPSLKPTLIPAIIISVIWTFNLFNVIYLVSAGEPGGANEILVTKAYKIAFQEYQYGYAAAYSTVIFFILCAYGFFQNKMSKATEDINR
ncbi:MAG: sugar ABC transporter permease [Acidobacteriota bacterium]|nr:sugar ABC transporter permease [Acidobacteriota bacterium]